MKRLIYIKLKIKTKDYTPDQKPVCSDLVAKIYCKELDGGYDNVFLPSPQDLLRYIPNKYYIV